MFMKQGTIHKLKCNHAMIEKQILYLTCIKKKPALLQVFFCSLAGEVRRIKPFRLTLLTEELGGLVQSGTGGSEGKNFKKN